MFSLYGMEAYMGLINDRVVTQPLLQLECRGRPPVQGGRPHPPWTGGRALLVT